MLRPFSVPLSAGLPTVPTMRPDDHEGYRLAAEGDLRTQSIWREVWRRMAHMSAVPVGDARDHFSELIAEVERTHERVTVTRHGRPVAVLLSPEDLESLEETLDILSQPGALEEIRESAQDVAAGRTVSIEEVRAEFGRRRE